MIGRKMKGTAFATRGELCTVAQVVPQWVQNPNVQIKRKTNDGRKTPPERIQAGRSYTNVGDTMMG